MRFSQGHWTFLGPRSEEKWYGISSHAQRGQWNCTADKMVQRFKETGHLVFKSISALSRGILKEKKGKTSIHSNGDSMNTQEHSFQTIHSVNQLSVCGAVANLCYQFGWTEEEKGRASTLVDNKILTKLRQEEVQLLVSPPTQTIGNRMREKVLSFDELAGQIQLTQCEKNLLPTSCCSRETVQNSTKWGRWMGNNYSFVPRILSSRSYPKNQALAAIPEGTVVGPVLEVHIVKIVDGYGIEVAIPSVAHPVDTSYVGKTRETERFVHEIHDHKEELRSSNELLADLQGSGRSEFFEERGTISIKETCAGPLSIPPSKKHPKTHKGPFIPDYELFRDTLVVFQYVQI